MAEIAILVIAIAIATAINLATRLNPDVAWLYVIAEKCLHGAVLYRDFIAVNAPFASIILESAVLFRNATALPVAAAVTLYVSGLALISYLAGASLIERYKAPHANLVALKVALFVTLFFLPGIEFAEREHLFCIMAAPYLLAFPLRRETNAVGSSLSFILGLSAALACNLKPPFAMIVLAVEAAGLIMLGWRSVFTAAQWGLCAAGLLSLLSYALLFPAYVTTVMPWMLTLYAAYNDTATTLREASLWGGLALIMFLLWGRDQNATMETLRRLLLVVTAAALANFMLQDKGWDYQAFPIAFCAVVLTIMAIAATPHLIARRLTASLALIVLLLRGATQFEAPDYVDYHFANMEKLIAASPGSFLILTTAGTPAGRHIVDTGHPWASRFPCLEMLPGIVAAERRGHPSPWEAPFRHIVEQDFATFQPPLVFVQLDQLPGLPADFDLLAWLKADPRFTAEWSHYHSDGSVDLHFAVFRRS